MSAWTVPRSGPAVVLTVMALFTATSACTSATSSSDDASSQPPSPTSTESPAPVPSDEPKRSYVAFGDSWPNGAHCDGCTPFPDLYAAQLDQQAPTEFTNLTTNGGTTSSLLADLRSSESTREAVAGADVIVISTGGNDWEAAFARWQAGSGCGPPQGIGCFRSVARNWFSTMDAILAEIDSLRGGQPTAVRVVSMSNEFLGDPGLISVFGPDFGAVQGARIVAWQKQAFCRAAARHDAQCLDLRPVLNGPAMDAPREVNTQEAMQRVADALAAVGLPELAHAGR